MKQISVFTAYIRPTTSYYIVLMVMSNILYKTRRYSFGSQHHHRTRLIFVLLRCCYFKYKNHRFPYTSDISRMPATFTDVLKLISVSVHMSNRSVKTKWRLAGEVGIINTRNIYFFFFVGEISSKTDKKIRNKKKNEQISLEKIFVQIHFGLCYKKKWRRISWQNK